MDRIDKARAFLKKLICVLIFALVFVLLFCCVTELVRDKRYADSAGLMYQPGYDGYGVDIVLAGSSHMLDGVNAQAMTMELRKGVINIAQNSQIIPETYYALMETLRVNAPSLVVLDIYKLLQDQKISSREALHFTLDGMRLGVPKIRAVYDLVEPGERAEYMFPVIAYHTRWKELGRTDLEAAMDTFDKFRTRGGQLLDGNYDNSNYQLPGRDEVAQIGPVSMDYLQRIVDLCDEKGVDLLLVAVPFGDDYDDEYKGKRQQTVNAAEKWANEKGIHFLNMPYMNDLTGLDMKTDFADRAHLNESGNRKITDFLANYIKENYFKPDGTLGTTV